jgi:hypothetical protein
LLYTGVCQKAEDSGAMRTRRDGGVRTEELCDELMSGLGAPACA